MFQAKEVLKLVTAMADRVRQRTLTVAVIGDMILDNAIEGVPGGPHPDIGVPMLRDATFQESIGGAANIALALSRLGVDVTLFGIIGSDLPGRQLENLLDRQPFADYLITERGWPTPRKDWIYHREEGRLTLSLRIDYGRPLEGRARAELVDEFRGRCPANVDVVILCDHGLGSIGAESLALVGLAKERKAKIVAIPRTTALRGQPLDAIVINAPEMRNLYDASADADPRPLAARYAREYSQHVFLTLMEEGIVTFPTGCSEGTLHKGFPLENAHWMGARDMAASMVAVGLAIGLTPLEAGQVATVCRHLVAAQRGNGRLTWRDVFEHLGVPGQ